MKKKRPKYKKIFYDMIKMKFPAKIKEYRAFTKDKKELETLDVVKLNEIIFGISDKETLKQNQRVRSYDKSTIIQILEYQKKYRLNNLQLSNHFRLSRNTVSAWKKRYQI